MDFGSYGQLDFARHDDGVADELDECGKHGFDARRGVDHRIRDARERHGHGRDGHPRVD